jgi:hypothetical protein
VQQALSLRPSHQRRWPLLADSHSRQVKQEAASIPDGRPAAETRVRDIRLVDHHNRRAHCASTGYRHGARADATGHCACAACLLAAA